jgi:hypothetical protein
MANLDILTDAQREILDPVIELGIPRDDLILVGGGAMQVYGLKRTQDIDVVVRPETLVSEIEAWESNRGLKRSAVLGRIGLQHTFTNQRKGVVKYEGSEYGAAEYGGITYMLAPNDHLFSASFEELQSDANEIGGVLVASPDQLLAWKLGVNRQKDKRDIQTLTEFIMR